MQSYGLFVSNFQDLKRVHVTRNVNFIGSCIGDLKKVWDLAKIKRGWIEVIQDIDQSTKRDKNSEKNPGYGINGYGIIGYGINL